MDVEAPPTGRVAAAKAAADAALFGLALIAACEAGEAGEDTTYANADSGAAATRKASRAAVLTNIIVPIACDVSAAKAESHASMIDVTDRPTVRLQPQNSLRSSLEALSIEL